MKNAAQIRAPQYFYYNRHAADFPDVKRPNFALFFCKFGGLTASMVRGKIGTTKRDTEVVKAKKLTARYLLII